MQLVNIFTSVLIKTDVNLPISTSVILITDVDVVLIPECKSLKRCVLHIYIGFIIIDVELSISTSVIHTTDVDIDHSTSVIGKPM